MATKVTVSRDGSVDIDFQNQNNNSYPLQAVRQTQQSTMSPDTNYAKRSITPQVQTSAPRATAITDLIDDLKQGKITKAQLFEQLAAFKASKANTSTLHTPSVNNNLRTPEQRTRGRSVRPQQHPSESFRHSAQGLPRSNASVDPRYRSVSEHASNMINNAAVSSLANVSQGSSLRQVSFADPQRPPLQSNLYNSKSYLEELQRQRATNSNVPQNLRSSRQNMTGRSIQRSTANAAEEWDREKSSTQTKSQALAKSTSTNAVRKPESTSSAQRARSQLMDVVGSQAECTFHPNVRDLPESYEGAALLKSYQKVDFTERVLLWQQQKKEELARRKETIKDETMSRCTFHPRINKNSERQLLGHNRSKPIEERLYYDTAYRHTRRRQELIETARQKADQEHAASCSFKPVISKRSEKYALRRTMRSMSAGRASSRVRRQQLQAMQLHGQNHNDPKSMPKNPNLTFHPRTNKLQRSMVSARNYLKQNWVDRLSKPHPSQVAPSEHGSGYYSDSGGDKENQRDQGGHRSRKSSTPMPYTRRTSTKYGRPLSAPPGRRSKAKGVEMTNAEKKASFKHFWQKQKTRSEQQKKRLEKSRSNNTPSFQPKITRRAHNHKQPRDFLERVKMHSDHWKRTRSEGGRQERFGQLMKNVANKGQYSSGEAFKPWLTNKSKASRHRTWTEMSTGDQRRREERRRMMKLMATKKLMKKATFEPNLATKSSRLAPSSEGRLKILSDPDTYVDRVRSRTHAMNSKTRRVQQQADLSKFKECTFHPKTKKVPKYITRISQTMKMAKELRRQQGLENGPSSPQKPEWR